MILWLLEYFQQYSMISRQYSYIKASIVQIFKIYGFCQNCPKIWIKKLLNVDQLLIWCSTPILKHLKLLHTFLPLRETPLKIEGAGAKNWNFSNFKIQLIQWLMEHFQQCSMISRQYSYIKASIVPNFQNLWTLPKLPKKFKLKNY